MQHLALPSRTGDLKCRCQNKKQGPAIFGAVNVEFARQDGALVLRQPRVGKHANLTGDVPAIVYA